MAEKIAGYAKQMGILAVLRMLAVTTIIVLETPSKAEWFKGMASRIAANPEEAMGKYFTVYNWEVKKELFAKVSARQSEGVVRVALCKVQQFVENHYCPGGGRRGYSVWVEASSGKYWIRGTTPVRRIRSRGLKTDGSTR